MVVGDDASQKPESEPEDHDRERHAHRACQPTDPGLVQPNWSASSRHVEKRCTTPVLSEEVSGNRFHPISAVGMDMSLGVRRVTRRPAQPIGRIREPCSGRRRRTLSRNHVIEPDQPTRSAIAVAGIFGMFFQQRQHPRLERRERRHRLARRRSRRSPTAQRSASSAPPQRDSESTPNPPQ